MSADPRRAKLDARVAAWMAEPGALDAIRGALALMAKGELRRMPIVVRGAALARGLEAIDAIFARMDASAGGYLVADRARAVKARAHAWVDDPRVGYRFERAWRGAEIPDRHREAADGSLVGSLPEAATPSTVASRWAARSR